MPNVCYTIREGWTPGSCQSGAILYLLPGTRIFPLLKLPIISKLPTEHCSTKVYNDCMVNVLADDKQATGDPHQAEDITIYCDDAPIGADYARCKENCIHQRPGRFANQSRRAGNTKIQNGYGMDTMEAVTS